MCGSRWLLSRHLTSLIVLVRHSSMLSSSQLDAYARNVGSSRRRRGRRSGGVHVPARTASLCSSSSTCARAGVHPSRSVPRRTRWRRPSTVMRSQKVRSPSLCLTISTLPRAGRGMRVLLVVVCSAPRAVGERLLGGRVGEAARLDGASVAGGVGSVGRGRVVQTEDAVRDALRREAPLVASGQPEASEPGWRCGAPSRGGDRGSARLARSSAGRSRRPGCGRRLGAGRRGARGAGDGHRCACCRPSASRDPPRPAARGARGTRRRAAGGPRQPSTRARAAPGV